MKETEGKGEGEKEEEWIRRCHWLLRARGDEVEGNRGEMDAEKQGLKESGSRC